MSFPHTNDQREKLGTFWESIPDIYIYTNILVFPKMVGFPPKSSISNRVFHVSHPFWGTTILGNTHIPPTYTAYHNSCIGQSGVMLRETSPWNSKSTSVLLRIWTINKSRGLGTVIFYSWLGLQGIGVRKRYINKLDALGLWLTLEKKLPNDGDK